MFIIRVLVNLIIALILTPMWFFPMIKKILELIKDVLKIPCKQFNLNGKRWLWE